LRSYRGDNYSDAGGNAETPTFKYEGSTFPSGILPTNNGGYGGGSLQELRSACEGGSLGACSRHNDLAAETGALRGPYLPSVLKDVAKEVGMQLATAPLGIVGKFGAKEAGALAKETAKVAELIPTHGKTMSNKQLDKLIKNIRAEGVKEPLTVTEHGGKTFILDGHHRALAAPRAGVSEVPVNRVELPFGAYKTPADLTFTPGGF